MGTRMLAPGAIEAEVSAVPTVNAVVPESTRPVTWSATLPLLVILMSWLATDPGSASAKVSASGSTSMSGSSSLSPSPEPDGVNS